MTRMTLTAQPFATARPFSSARGKCAGAALHIGDLPTPFSGIGVMALGDGSIASEVTFGFAPSSSVGTTAAAPKHGIRDHRVAEHRQRSAEPGSWSREHYGEDNAQPAERGDKNSNDRGAERRNPRRSGVRPASAWPPLPSVAFMAALPQKMAEDGAHDGEHQSHIANDVNKNSIAIRLVPCIPGYRRKTEPRQAHSKSPPSRRSTLIEPSGQKSIYEFVALFVILLFFPQSLIVARTISCFKTGSYLMLTLGIIIGNRGFFPAHLCQAGTRRKS